MKMHGKWTKETLTDPPYTTQLYKRAVRIKDAPVILCIVPPGSAWVTPRHGMWELQIMLAGEPMQFCDDNNHCYRTLQAAKRGAQEWVNDRFFVSDLQETLFYTKDTIEGAYKDAQRDLTDAQTALRKEVARHTAFLALEALLT
jgi:hypothetical protein